MSIAALERRWTRAENAFFRSALDAGDAFLSRRRRHATARALSAMDESMLRDIGMSRFELDFGAPRSRRRADV